MRCQVVILNNQFTQAIARVNSIKRIYLLFRYCGPGTAALHHQTLPFLTNNSHRVHVKTKQFHFVTQFYRIVT